MKRSEALLKIKDVLDSLDEVCTNKLKADVILTQLEGAGMSPPVITKFITSQFMEKEVTSQEWENETV